MCKCNLYHLLPYKGDRIKKKFDSHSNEKFSNKKKDKNKEINFFFLLACFLILFLKDDYI